MTFSEWLRQPTTINGLGVAAAAIGGALSHLTTGNTTVDTIVSMIAFALVHLTVHDNTAPK